MDKSFIKPTGLMSRSPAKGSQKQSPASNRDASVENSGTRGNSHPTLQRSGTEKTKRVQPIGARKPSPPNRRNSGRGSQSPTKRMEPRRSPERPNDQFYWRGDPIHNAEVDARIIKKSFEKSTKPMPEPDFPRSKYGALVRDGSNQPVKRESTTQPSKPECVFTPGCCFVSFPSKPLPQIPDQTNEKYIVGGRGLLVPNPLSTFNQMHVEPSLHAVDPNTLPLNQASDSIPFSSTSQHRAQDRYNMILRHAGRPPTFLKDKPSSKLDVKNGVQSSNESSSSGLGDESREKEEDDSPLSVSGDVKSDVQLGAAQMELPPNYYAHMFADKIQSIDYEHRCTRPPHCAPCTRRLCSEYNPTHKCDWKQGPVCRTCSRHEPHRDHQCDLAYGPICHNCINNAPVCYNCSKLGHYVDACPTKLTPSPGSKKISTSHFSKSKYHSVEDLPSKRLPIMPEDSEYPMYEEPGLFEPFRRSPCGCVVYKTFNWSYFFKWMTTGCTSIFASSKIAESIVYSNTELFPFYSEIYAGLVTVSTLLPMWFLRHHYANNIHFHNRIPCLPHGVNAAAAHHGVDRNVLAFYMNLALNTTRTNARLKELKVGLRSHLMQLDKELYGGPEGEINILWQFTRCTYAAIDLLKTEVELCSNYGITRENIFGTITDQRKCLFDLTAFATTGVDPNGRQLPAK